MPSTYAHYRFGRDVMASTRGDVCKDIVENLDLYNIGLHGPDILFYHDALVKNRVNAIGFAMHDRPGKEFFGPAKEVLEGMADRSAGRAYLYGFICHFMLDSECHPYIEEKIAESGVSHTRIESEFDRVLLERDGFDPFKKDLTSHIHPSPELSTVISPFLPGVTAEEVEKSLRDMVTYNGYINTPSRLKRTLIERKLKATGNLEDMGGMLIGLKPEPKCADSNAKLTDLYGNAVRPTAMLMESYLGYLENGDELPSRFDRTFSVE
ncbi:MAG: hypothetical protein ACI38Y_03635 [Candidatus Methanomethylophilaceae archaeon]